MKRILFLILALVMIFSGCSTAEKEVSYTQITQDEAKERMDEEGVVILDVREQDEYDAGHIKGAVLLPVGEIEEESAKEVIGDKDKVVLVYCRTGNRSKTASQALVDLGYTAVFEFGGISTWEYDIEM
ncbi:MAG: rhodanese-like domain-containing protein [Firmicutes bacterium]|nr:rhodanese-like domain-containing protein [Bacillota bacterium]